jgi:hypothetical protein
MLEDIWADLTNPANINAHLAYVFIIASMSMTQMRWLRILALASGITAMLHFFFQTRDTVSLAWEAIFPLPTLRSLHCSSIVQDRSPCRRSSAALPKARSPGSILPMSGRSSPFRYGKM